MTNQRTKIAWVTGGGTGIGKAGAQALLADGWTVIISGRRAEVLKAVADELGAGGKPVEAMALDVSNAADVQKVADAILAKYGRIDLLVNSAGVNVPKRSWQDVTQDGWDQIVDINL
ncbi:MAG: SDR family oxidoreductase, partial [Tardiphaga sp.]